MPRTAPPPNPPLQQNLSSFEADQKRELVQRVIKSEMFRRSPAMRAFLLYITDEAVLGRAEKLKEQVIGVEVLGRKPNYDPADDNIVRVRAHELRGRLERYFASEGAKEPIVITMPPGGYAPEFLPRKTAAAETPVIPQIAAKASAPNEKSATVSQGRSWWLLTATVVAAILISIALTRYVLESEARATAVRPTGAIHDFWSQFFEKPNEDLKIVYADTNFALWQELNGKTLNLGDYLDRKYLNLPGDKFPEFDERRVTSLADIAVGAHLGVLAGEFGGQVNLRFARDADTDFLHHGNIVLIGSHRSNPWVEVYEPRLNFQLDEDPRSRAPLFRNRSPQRGEAQVYALPAMFDTQRIISYGVVALLKGCGSRGLTVLVEGLNVQATQAAGDMVTDPQLLETLLQSTGQKPGTNVTPFEALIQITSLPVGYDNPKVIAYRLRSAQSCIGD